MSPTQTNATLLAAQKLLQHLPEPLHHQLSDLLEQAEQGQDTTIEVIDLLSEQDNIRMWMDDQVSLSCSTKGYGRLGGNSTAIRASYLWVCPQNDCTYSLPVIQEGEDPPLCLQHNVEMVRGDSKEQS